MGSRISNPEIIHSMRQQGKTRTRNLLLGAGIMGIFALVALSAVAKGAGSDQPSVSKPVSAPVQFVR